ncbi:MAG: hypothetical protein EOP13_09460 [Pseudomonas sp.]|uniref:hypothetical protein n=1 Tax=Pseudomonas sp. TaxID=306 RepID=UPI0012206E29|nr:hypothetical protein [Pseudomonas sp.]RZI74191.1 MAG: hypothetical protein EOP13_09460 [Pseudomonas sp.]
MDKKWMAVLAAIVAAGAAWAWWYPGHDATLAAAPSNEQPVAPSAASDVAVAASASAAASPAPVSSSASAAVLMAKQVEAAKEIERDPGMKPIVGPITERPAFVSELEWQMLKGVAQQKPAPEQELTHLVNHLRFMKQLELWQSLEKSPDLAKRQTLALQLLDDLPQRVASGDLDKASAQKLQADLLKDAVSDPQQRKARAEVEAKRLVEPAPAK